MTDEERIAINTMWNIEVGGVVRGVHLENDMSFRHFAIR